MQVNTHGQNMRQRNIREGGNRKWRCLNWPHPARVTRLHHRWGAPEAEIFVFKFLPWPEFEPRTSQSNDRGHYHSTTAPPLAIIVHPNNNVAIIIIIIIKVIIAYSKFPKSHSMLSAAYQLIHVHYTGQIRRIIHHYNTNNINSGTHCTYTELPTHTLNLRAKELPSLRPK